MTHKSKETQRKPNRFPLSIFLIFFLSLIFLFNSSLSAQDKAAGEQTFKTTCSACHAFGRRLVGPDLTGVMTRWKDQKKLIAFVQDPNKFLDKDPYVMKLQQEAGGARMAVPAFTEDQVKNVLAYANTGGGAGETAGNTANTSTGTGNAGGGMAASNTEENAGLFGMSFMTTLVLLIVVFLVLLGAALVLIRVRRHLAQIEVERTTSPTGVPGEPKGWLERKWEWSKANVNPTLVVLLIIALVTLYSFLNWYHRAQDLGTQYGYAPEQPIRFNHKLHAGQYQIKCQYCHSGVEISKNAGIPSLSTCMNCHDYIKQGPQYGTTEIAKLEDAYKNNKPVKWVRIHNLPDHVYFNHSQHIVAGKLTCDRCHGPVQEMERVQQVATLEMGWCINCHRETGIDKSNPYYTATFDFVKQHKDKKFTVAQMGGMECIRCHY